MEGFNQNIDNVTELESRVAVLEREKQQANELVSMATHQIRGPVGAIKGYISLVLQGDYGEIPPALVEPLNIIFNSTDHLSKTVNDFLDVSRIEQGEMRYYRKDFDLVHLADEVIKEMQKSITGAGLELRQHISSEPLLIHGDKAKLKHVLLNLIDNACKYTKHGWIEISLGKSAAGKAIFFVRDSGVGLKKETLPLLFQKFSRGSEANKANTHGTGLGLYVARKMVEAQNGRIWAESEGEGEGAQFNVELNLIT